MKLKKGLLSIIKKKDKNSNDKNEYIENEIIKDSNNTIKNSNYDSLESKNNKEIITTTTMTTTTTTTTSMTSTTTTSSNNKNNVNNYSKNPEDKHINKDKTKEREVLDQKLNDKYQEKPKDKSKKFKLFDISNNSSENKKHSISKSKDNSVIEYEFKIQYKINDKSGASLDEEEIYENRTIRIQKEGVALLDEKGNFDTFKFQDIKEFVLDPNWMDWKIMMNNGTVQFFRSYESLQIHLKVNNTIQSLVKL